MRMPLRGLGPPGDEVGNLSEGDSHPYAMWDAAYVLGSLSAADRREFETHLAGCPSCREAVAELGGVPALLSQLDLQDMASINESGTAAGARPPRACAAGSLPDRSSRGWPRPAQSPPRPSSEGAAQDRLQAAAPPP